ncbi:ATP synthase subunit d, mitochondrial isoform X1 [Dendrobium catenatum]|uniref:ATP synthase subunit d, mitochondrial isoform X1 n=1 Tax=Dendrobium catenatum TaxID=906689 RepID=UPI0010A03B93|nr:ATP synthase subunit d, mitochondrial isoform X1 [Dendrobium catenatum]
MSGSGAKKVVETAVKATKAIDWDAMAKLIISDEARKEFANLRRAFDDVNQQLQTKFSQEPEPIDWEYYRKGIGPRLVDMYKEAYEKEEGKDWKVKYIKPPQTVLWWELIALGVEIPKFVDTVTPQYKPKFDALLVELKEAEQTSLKETERLDKEIAEVQELKQKICTMTAEEYFQKHPELKKKFEDEIRNDYWGYGPQQ